MADPIKPAVAVREFLQSGPDGRPVPLQEYAAFWKGCSDKERSEFARDAAKALGRELSAE